MQDPKSFTFWAHAAGVRRIMGNHTLSKVGGVHIGSFAASWPFANLKVTHDSISIRALTKKVSFKTEQISSFSVKQGLIFKGIQFNLANNQPSQYICFWCVNIDPDTLIQDIHHIGFIPSGEPTPLIKDLKARILESLWLKPAITIFVGALLIATLAITLGALF